MHNPPSKDAKLVEKFYEKLPEFGLKTLMTGRKSQAAFATFQTTFKASN